MGDLRDIYDRCGKKVYRTGIDKAFSNHAMIVIACGTSSSWEMDKTKAGARFLNCVMMEEIDLSLERDIQRTKRVQAFQQVKLSVNCTAESNDPPAMCRAKQRTAGYLEWLLANVEELTSKIVDSEEAGHRWRSWPSSWPTSGHAHPSRRTRRPSVRWPLASPHNWPGWRPCWRWCSREELRTMR